MKILLAEDDRILRAAYKAIVEEGGYTVVTAKDGEEALKRFSSDRPDLVLLDVMMPVMDGFGACRAIRALDASVPILFLTALDDERSELEGLGYGADDYIVKGVSTELMLARISAALRRSAPSAPPVPFAFGAGEVDPVRHTIKIGLNTVVLTLREVEILRLFASRAGEVVSRDFLLTRFCDPEADDAALYAMMHRLKDKLGPLGDAISAVRSNGYVCRFNPSRPCDL